MVPALKHCQGGDEFTAVASEKAARAATEAAVQAKASSLNRGTSSTELLRIINRNELQELKYYRQSRRAGLLTSVIDSLKAMDTAEVAIRVVSSGVGAITDNDIRLAAASGAIIYGFSVRNPSNIRQEASRDRVASTLQSHLRTNR